MEKNEFFLLRYIFQNGIDSYRKMSSSLNVSLGLIHSVMSSLENSGLIDNAGVTKKGIEELEKYRVKSAVIMAAGMSTRMAPLSFEKPKGLFEIKNEVLIERQIKQLKEAGIDDITIVLGYKKESFFYLGEKYDVKIIINPIFAITNNSETIYLANEHISNSYICSSDNYFVDNPFNLYEYHPYFAVEKFENEKDGYYLVTGRKEKIIGRKKGVYSGFEYKGMMYWDSSFSGSILKLLSNHHQTGDLNQDSIYSVILNHLHELPDIFVSIKPANTIFKFFDLKALRKFDEKYIENTSSAIMNNIATTLKCKEGDVRDFKPIKEGLTNTSYTFIVKGKKYVYRHPGEGTDKIINRSNEKGSLELAKQLNIDPTFIKMDAKQGWKISSFADNCREPDYNNPADGKLIIQKLKELHCKKAKVSWKFKPWEDALTMEHIIRQKQNIDMPDFESLKSDIFRIYQMVKDDNLVEKCFCHCDTYKPNWLINKDTNDVILIDWEYAGHSDPAVDVAYYIVDAMYDFEQAKQFIKEYIGEQTQLEKHFMAYIPIVAYYWFVWALFRESCSAVMGESLYNWYYMAKKYAKFFLK